VLAKTKTATTAQKIEPTNIVAPANPHKVVGESAPQRLSEGSGNERFINPIGLEKARSKERPARAGRQQFTRAGWRRPRATPNPIPRKDANRTTFEK
jgi:hypothetical protein